MKKHLLVGLVSSLLSATAYSATTIEVSAFYQSGSGFNVSQEIVGVYRSLENINELMAEKGINAEFKPTYFGTLSDSEVAPTENVFSGLQYMNGLDANIEDKTDVGDIAIGIFPRLGRDYGFSQLTQDDTYTDEPNETRKIAIAGEAAMGLSDSSALVYLAGHELFHAIGAVHEQSGAISFNTQGDSREDGFANTCDNGYQSLMGASSLYTDKENISIAGAIDCSVGGGDVVDFVNQYASSVGTIAAERNNRTLTVSASENMNTQSFDISVTRTDTSAEETIRVYIAGGYSDTGAGLTPIDVTFGVGEASASTNVLFDDVYPIFDAADGTEQSTYVVAVGDNEISESAYDILAVNTQWTSTQVGEPDDQTNDSAGADSDGGSGGALGVWGLFLFIIAGVRRYFKN